MTAPRQKRPPLAGLDAAGIVEHYKGVKLRSPHWHACSHFIPISVFHAHQQFVHGTREDGGLGHFGQLQIQQMELYRAPKPKKKPGKKVTRWAFEYGVTDSRLRYFYNPEKNETRELVNSNRNLYLKQGYICGPIFRLTGIAPAFPKQTKNKKAKS